MPFQIYPATIAIYEELFSQSTIRKKFKLKLTRQEKLLICKFIVWLNKNYKPHQLNEVFLIQYFEYQFSRYSGVVTPNGKNSIMLNWVIGPKAFTAWKNRAVSKRWLVRYRCNKEFKLQLKQAFTAIPVNRVNLFLQCNQFEEQEKQRFYNTPQGYLYCAQMTTIYNPVSELCVGCKYKIECKERLKINFKKLYDERNKIQSL